MKARCNVCGNKTLIGVPKIANFDEIVDCPECGKLIAYSEQKDRCFSWVFMDTEFNKDVGFIPVEIINN